MRPQITSRHHLCHHHGAVAAATCAVACAVVCAAIFPWEVCVVAALCGAVVICVIAVGRDIADTTTHIPSAATHSASAAVEATCICVMEQGLILVGKSRQNVRVEEARLNANASGLFKNKSQDLISRFPSVLSQRV